MMETVTTIGSGREAFRRTLEGLAVTQATLRSEDLLENFLDVLHAAYRANALTIDEIEDVYEEGLCLMEAVRILADDDRTLNDDEGLSDEVDWWLNESAYELLNDLAPEGYYFGSHEGDGTLIGFWRIDEEDVFF